jgi:hypothetical protein
MEVDLVVAVMECAIVAPLLRSQDQHMMCAFAVQVPSTIVKR